MIKITIKDRAALEADYLKRMLTPLNSRIDYLKLSLTHIAVPASIVINNNGIESYKSVTGKIAMIIEDKKSYIKKDFDVAKYCATVFAYVNGQKNNLTDIDIPKLLAFLNGLSNNNFSQLKELLICPPEKLLQKNKNIKNGNSFNTKEIKILSLAITYSYSDLSDAAKGFFRKHNLVKTCPYCNLENAEHKEEKRQGIKVTARVHQLDHFFSRKDHPLLALSMYNLVPSGISCNSPTCKGEICFKDSFHLNPYIGGFNSDARFVPVTNGIKTSEVELNFFGIKGGSRYMQIMGDDSDTSKKKYEKGNVNVFKLRGVYSNLEAEADSILDLVNRRIGSKSPNLRFWHKMAGIDRGAVHKKWYQKEVKTSFDPEDFNEKPMSKFNRDIHDFYVINDIRSQNDYLRDLIKY